MEKRTPKETLNLTKKQLNKWEIRPVNGKTGISVDFFLKKIESNIFFLHSNEFYSKLKKSNINKRKEE